MSYLVMECHPGYAVLLDEDGRFLKAANLRYEIGQTVYDPVLMKETPERRRHTVRWISSGIAAIAACFLLFFGLGYYQNYIRPYSSIYLTINPEVQMDLNRQGMVVRLTGTNEDGKALLEGYDGKGKDKVTAADELIDRAIEMGFLSEGGRVSFSIDSPDEALFQEYGTELRTEVTEHLDGRITVTIEITNHKDGQGQKTRRAVRLQPPLSRNRPLLPRLSRLTPRLCLRRLPAPPIMMIRITARITTASPITRRPTARRCIRIRTTAPEMTATRFIRRLPPVRRLRIRTMVPAAMGPRIIRTGIPIMIRETTTMMMWATAATAAMTTMIRMMTTIRTMTTEFFKKFSSLPRF